MAYRWARARPASDPPCGRRRLPPHPSHRLLPSVARDPAPHLVRPLDGLDRLHRLRQLAHLGLHRETAGGTLLIACAFLGWFASLARGRMPKGLRDAGAYAIGYTAQATAYLLLATDRYPNADPTEMLVAVTDRPPRHPVRVAGDPFDLRRSRVTVFFRFLLALPHILWLAPWGIVVFLAAIAQWFVTLFRGTP